MTKRTRNLLVAGLLALLGHGTALLAQAPAQPGKIYTKKTAFKLPVRIDEKERHKVQKVQLFVKQSATDPWACKETVAPTQGEFLYNAPKDGEYWFGVVTIDKAGRATPADLNKEGPGLIVVVDTTAPECEIKPITSGSGELLFQCEIKDANPDAVKTKMEFQMPDKSWQALEAMPQQPTMFRVTNAGMLKGCVRATCCDLAGNSVVRVLNLAPKNETAEAHKLPDNIQQAAAVTTQTTPAPIQQAVAQSPGTSMPNPIQQAYLPNPAPQQPAPQQQQPARETQVVNSCQLSLEYQVEQQGPSGVSKVEIYMTRDNGQSWQKLSDDADCMSPVEINLPGDGIYGLSLVVTSGAGAGGTPPKSGDAGDWSIEVDTVKPAAQMIGVRPTEEQGVYMISWSAADKNMKNEPIDLYYSVQKDGPYQPIAKGVANSGQFRWILPKGSVEYYVRMEARDRANNVTVCDAPQALVFDTAMPKARVVGVVSPSMKVSPVGN